jgi:DNA-binding protein H-NS
MTAKAAKNPAILAVSTLSIAAAIEALQKRQTEALDAARAEYEALIAANADAIAKAQADAAAAMTTFFEKMSADGMTADDIRGTTPETAGKRAVKGVPTAFLHGPHGEKVGYTVVSGNTVKLCALGKPAPWTRVALQVAGLELATAKKKVAESVATSTDEQGLTQISTVDSELQAA